MWAHYADNHLGFCTEYAVTIPETLPLIGPHSVTYTTDWPVRINPNEIVFCPISTINRIVTTKGAEWAHEREYRLIDFGMLDLTKQEPGKVKALPDSFKPTQIIAGVRTGKNDCNQLKEVAATLNIDFKKMDNDSFHPAH